MRKTSPLTLLLRFRNDLLLLWRGFLHPDTPFFLKAAMIAVIAYLLSPIDLIPDVLPLIGIVDDVAVVALAVGWIASRLPASVRNPGPSGGRPRRDGKSGGTTIDGSARRL
jgi:uncharacterized membrane protein YkvA (DUF1232 family)